MSAVGGPAARDCPCGTGRAYSACCGPYVGDGQPAPTAEALMRSRYTAYSLGVDDHVFRTWHPRTRPADTVPDPSIRWVGLEVLDVTDGGEGDEEGFVKYRARWATPAPDDQRGQLEERSHFVRRAGRWVYLGPA
ncbi:SEC-C domain-containing protein [Ornithinimicrobium sp. F0845]|uniref:YchJ family protein n=1 Tax=Ornithinimicrobium sp. F0845 TaxID=2926412 RepID=UPI001FF45FD8|nr:SEC-C domain-containing protein [Ornithinimicrobium sp. F0845]